jgi:hypothetical protein
MRMRFLPDAFTPRVRWINFLAEFRFAGASVLDISDSFRYDCQDLLHCSSSHSSEHIERDHNCAGTPAPGLPGRIARFTIVV